MTTNKKRYHIYSRMINLESGDFGKTYISAKIDAISKKAALARGRAIANTWNKYTGKAHSKVFIRKVKLIGAIPKKKRNARSLGLRIARRKRSYALRKMRANPFKGFRGLLGVRFPF